jgi:hypothetical protein
MLRSSSLHSGVSLQLPFRLQITFSPIDYNLQ